MVDAEDLKSFGHCDRVGSSPTIPTRCSGFGCVAQLVRALRSHRRGRWFESNHIHHKNTHRCRCFFCFFSCSDFRNFANIQSEMNKILSFLCSWMLCIGIADAAVRDGNATVRAASALQQRVNTTVKSTGGRTGGVRIGTNTAARNARATTTSSTHNRTISSRAAAVQPTASRAAATSQKSLITRSATTQQKSVTARAADTTTTAMSETRTGAAYEQCKTAFFTCMDQFCQLKNDDYRRCSCSDRVLELAEIRDVMQDASDKLTVFNENLDTVGMTAAQASAMKTASEGENALTSDKSASKALLQAIMNSIKGEDTTVGGKYADLNSISLAFDTTNSFGTLDAGAAVAAYNGKNLYSAVYPQCRSAVRADCSDAALQRAINAYLMAIEQDCNAVQTAIETKQKKIKSAVRESSAMLDLTRVENRQNHNSSDLTTCINEVEAAILSEEVCGANYHKCLDNGEFIDISTGKPIAGVERFYELGEMLKFADGVDAANQKLSKVNANRTFVQTFENKVKKFAQPALDKCTEQADTAWAEYLDKALLAIYYSQQSKVDEIQQGCFDFVSSCYINNETALTAAMKELSTDSALVLQPDKITLSNDMCSDYITSCDKMFGGTDGKGIIAKYIENRKDTDTLAACRAVVKQCFDKFGGNGYQNFYYPSSGLFKSGEALDWFTLYTDTATAERQECIIDDGCTTVPATITHNNQTTSQCAKQLQSIPSCSSEEMMKAAFGGFDRAQVIEANNEKGIKTAYIVNAGGSLAYGTPSETEEAYSPGNGMAITKGFAFAARVPRPTGVATEIYNQILDTLTIQCTNVDGRFVEYKFIDKNAYKENDFCKSNFDGSKYGPKGIYNLMDLYGLFADENMCPRGYIQSVDTQSWGACLCWENGGRRSKWGTSTKCEAVLPIKAETANKDGTACTGQTIMPTTTETTAEDGTTQTHPTAKEDVVAWCTQSTLSLLNQVCSIGTSTKTGVQYCIDKEGNNIKSLPEGM